MHAMGARIGVLKPYWRNLMSALLKVTTRSSVTLDGLHGGSDTALFTSGSAPSSVSAQSSGALTELFTSGS